MPPQLHRSDENAVTDEVEEQEEGGTPPDGSLEMGPADGEAAALSFSPAELAHQHRAVARATGGRARRAFMARLQGHEALLQEAYEHFVRVSQEEPVLSYAAEWYLDNYYLLQRVNNQIEEDFSEQYYRELPKLQGVGALDGYPRVFDIARHLVAQGACEIDEGRIRRFLDKYQEVNPLRIGELWALPIMLRIVLLEYVIQSARATPNEGPPSLIPLSGDDLIATCIPSLRALSYLDWKTFVESVSYVDGVLRQDPAGVYERMDFETRDRYRKAVEELALHSNTEEVAVAEATVRLASKARQQTAGQASARDGGRPNATYGDPSIIEDVSSAVVGQRSAVDARYSHVGYYLIDKGRPQLEEALNYRLSLAARLKETLKGDPTFIYIGSISAGTLAILFVALAYLNSLAATLPLTVLTLFLLVVPAVTVVTSVVNWLVTRIVPPRVLPKLDFSEDGSSSELLSEAGGIPPEHRTFVVIPSMLGDREEVQSLLRQLEGHFLRNPERNLCFALLTDFADAQEEGKTAAEEQLLDAAREGIEALNRAYPQAPFYLFHRRRLWNERENVWMGWERKRGKLHEFNRLLRGAEDTSFTVQVGDLSRLEGVRYVITLDTDTILPRDGAARLVGAMAHPLNRAQFDAETGEVIAGYTILQPRTETQPDWSRQSLFTRVFAGDSGLDLYSQAVSNVYQDLFGEGIYMGKGIYDIDAFERSLEGRVPENSLLSHDLFEGIHGRAGLISDVIFFEDYPAHYLLQVRRTHRWVRGDWQLLPWLLPTVPASSGRQRNRLSLIDRWKIVDNLRRSLLSPLLLLLLIAGWTILPGSPVVWTLVAVLTPALALMTGVIAAIGQFVAAASEATDTLKRQLRDSMVRWMLYIAFLPYEATLNVDAIVTTLARLFVTRRNLLQWTTASHTSRLFGDEVSADLAWQQMISSFLVSAIIGIVLFIVNPDVLAMAFPLLLLWSLSPELAYVISRPEKPKIADVGDEQKARLRRLARRTWFFFERFVGPDDNWLPPDHFQEEPKGVVAHRTSPTNIGLYLLSAIAAHDFGYIDPMALMLRLRSAFDAMEHLERYRGHFLNWHDTTTLTALPPRYVSTVDSGNLAGCLIALQQALGELPEKPALRWARWQGFLDTLDLFIEALSDGAPRQDVAGFKAYVAGVEEKIEAVRETPAGWPRLLEDASETWLPEMERRLIGIVERAREGAGEQRGISPDRLHDWRLFIERAADHIQNMKREQELLAPWLAALADPPALFARDGDNLGAEVRRAWEELRQATRLPTSDFSKLATASRNQDVYGLPSLRDVAPIAAEGRRALEELRSALDEAGDSPTVEEALAWAEGLDERLESGRWMAQSVVAGCAEMRQRAETLVREMDFKFLFHAQRQVFHIGYNLDAGRLDDNYYDLLASEARIASLVAIAKNDVPFSHWLHLARPVTGVQGRRTLLSWSGTMFEYLMPPLLLRTYKGTLLDSSARQAIGQQMAYVNEGLPPAVAGMPWGISESGFYTFDAAMNYQYRAFGVPGLGFKRGLGEDLVVSPYASVLALPFRPEDVLANLERLDALGMKGRYGYFEAVDFTDSRLGPDQRASGPAGAAIVRSYMAHHQGMIFLALLNFLKDGRMRERFHADARIQSVELLLQERIPYGAPLETPQAEETASPAPQRARVPTHAWRVPTQTPMPAVHHLSNGRYEVLFTNSGGGYSRWNGIALTRWRPDTTLDNWGQWLYLQDRDGGALWSAALQPVGGPEAVAAMELSYYPHKVQWRRRDHGITLHAELLVAPDDDVEIRRYRLTNTDGDRRRLRLTSYAEVVLTDQATDRRHQAFAKLFVENEFLSHYDALLFRRRPRAHDEEPVFLGHMALVYGEEEDRRQEEEDRILPSFSYETDRMRFLGRNGSLARPAGIEDRRQKAEGRNLPSSLDPIASLSRTVTLAPYSTVEVAFITMAARSREQLEQLLDRYHSWSMLDRAAELSRSRADHELQRLELGSPTLRLGQQLLSLLLYPHAARRADPATLAANRKGQPGLWAYGISGDYPVLLLIMHDESESELLQELLRIHDYWYGRGLKIDLVILNEEHASYGQTLQGYIFRSVRRAGAADRLQRRGGVFILSRDQLGDEEYHLLQAAARVRLDGARGSLEEQMEGIYEQPARLPALGPTRTEDRGQKEEDRGTSDFPSSFSDLLFFNGFGGFSPGGDGEPAGKEYVIRLQPGESTPAPWINVIANPDFGFVVSESGGGFTWSVNSGENRLTAWRNDPVLDRPAEAVYLRDEETAEVWSPTPPGASPATVRDASGPYTIRHGAGYTIFHHQSHALEQELSLFVDTEASVKIARLRLKNLAPRQRRLTATYYAEWVLGTARDITQQYLIPEYVGECNALLVRNPYNVEFGQRVAFLAASREPHGVTADRSEFLGRPGSQAPAQRPAALQRIGLENAVNAGLDTCGAMQLHVDLGPGETETVYFLLGQGEDREHALELLGRFQSEEAIDRAWQQVHEHWDRILGAVQVHTPDEAMNLMLNRWLLYQALSCRIWGRSALYQSSGAYGFRDQLQDVMALVHSRPDLTRQHILRAARQQFEEGDVLHWWHPPSGRGVRTRISDDLLWLPFVTAHYVSATGSSSELLSEAGDEAILEEKMPFLKGKPLSPEEEERYGHYTATDESFTLFEHCVRALYKGMTRGRHGLPLIGAGDWNDGMNRVGIEGQGESVWLGWFLYDTLQRFADLCQRVGKDEYAASFRERAAEYQDALENAGWDGEWYRRAYYDDGTPLGSRQNMECQIDAIAQSWSVLSVSNAAAGDGSRRQLGRQAQAMAAVEQRLIDRENRLLLLFKPPFDKTEKDPGYIKGYPPGIRENGGQYTHAAIWTVWAFAQASKRASSQGEKAEALFRLLNPVYHAATREAALTYRVEPYVIAADVYGAPPHTGRGGWTWYTGSSGWMYRLGLEAILGLQREGDALRIDPVIPAHWPSYRIRYRFGDATYHIEVVNDGEERAGPLVTLDGQALPDERIPLQKDGRRHQVEVRLPRQEPDSSEPKNEEEADDI